MTDWVSSRASGPSRADEHAGLWVSMAGQVQDSVRLKAIMPDLKSAYSVYLQPLLVELGLSTLEMAGAVELEARIERTHLSGLRLVLDNVYVEDQQGRFWASAVNGELVMNSGLDPIPSRISDPIGR